MNACMYAQRERESERASEREREREREKETHTHIGEKGNESTRGAEARGAPSTPQWKIDNWRASGRQPFSKELSIESFVHIKSTLYRVFWFCRCPWRDSLNKRTSLSFREFEMVIESTLY